MNFKKILIATSMLAAISAPSYALNINDTARPTNHAVNPATELQNQLVLVNGVFHFNLETNAGGSFPAGQNIIVEFLAPPGLKFGSNITAAAVGDGDAVSSSAVVRGLTGAVGTSLVGFDISTDAVTPDSSIGFDLDLALDVCPQAGDPSIGDIVVSASFSNGNPIEEGSVSIPAETFMGSVCESAIGGVVLSDEVASDTIILLPAYDTLGPDGIIGTVNYTIDPTVAIAVDTAAPGVPIPMTGPGEVASVTFDIVFVNDTGITAVDVGGVGAVDLGGNIWRVTQAPGGSLVDGVADEVTLTAPGGLGEIVTQPISIASASLVFADRPNGAGEVGGDLIVGEAGANGGLDELQREGLIFGFNDWNAENGAVNSIYRITGLDGNPATAVDVPYTIRIENSSTGVSGTFRGLIPAAAIIAGNGEVRINSRNLFGLGGALNWGVGSAAADIAGYGTADMLLTIETNLTGVDTDRFVASKGGVVSTFGDAMNTDDNSTVEPDSDDDN